ncbi:GTP-binding protein, putative [Hepatocystis sp. ex Piliocolobus tephrosceles]|nr:GTP-binding protein, putative [Hepatocystis sp. ex Piliocolobus tephrosceles]
MIKYINPINIVALKRNTFLKNCMLTKRKKCFSIKIIDSLTKKNVKVYVGSGKNKTVETQKAEVKEEPAKEKNDVSYVTHDKTDNQNGNVTKEAVTDDSITDKLNKNDIINLQNSLSTIFQKKSIFYESERIIRCESGRGGDGCMSYKKFKKKVFGSLGIPNGGKGGNGGSIYLCYCCNLKKQKNSIKNNDQNKYIYITNLNELPTVLSATNGCKGKARQVRGNNGKSIYVYLNKICHVYQIFTSTNGDNNKICDTNKSKEDIDSNGSQLNDKECYTTEELNKNGDNRINKLCDDTCDSTNANITHKNSFLHIESTLNNDKSNKQLTHFTSAHSDRVYNTIKREDPVYLKKNNHVLKQLMLINKKIQKDTYIGILNEKNNCILLAKGGEGGKGNNMQNTFSYDTGKEGVVTYIRIIFKCISDICFIGYENAGKSSLLSLITHKIRTVNNLYVLKTIFFKDNFQISVADFFSNTDTVTSTATVVEKSNVNSINKKKPFHINLNLLKFLEMTHVLVIVLDCNDHIYDQFLSIRTELKLKNESIYLKPYIVVINKCDVTFQENIKKADQAYNQIKLYDDTVPIFFISAKYGIGINEFVMSLRRCVEKAKQIKT